ncbi:NAD-dependent epimerase/dehydratase family protein [Amorphoplanes digitatis]|uniref:Nucleoside-diphosphate-sugar epimerase n=1 Tax=Actinoplanes digitatis TaxID=1868 RepID=A0A7W7MR87_9ACTN|nr:NAD-dependent epimerase/dehydratase family protein [Actinoplanes digitatis]MBB4763370.1 nucleoside-diphosphate-sugar epimerase [Actinoplanes digitatis]
MRLLVLGGTGFVGRAVVDEARTRGHHITVLNRGHQPAPPGTTALIGDRRAPGGLAALHGGAWDAVVDTWSGAPNVVRDSAAALRGHAGHYTYVSSRSVYATDDKTVPHTEAAPVVDADPDSGDADDYASAKRGAELAAEQNFDGPVLHGRAGLILGPHEDIGRLPWWLNRIARGGPTLAPGPPEMKLQYIDARDLAAWLLDAAAAGRTGPYDLVSPPGHTTMAELLETINTVTGGHAELRWTDPKTILDAGITPWMELPIWLAPGYEYDFLHGGDVSKALRAGLRLRPVGETVADTWSWLCSVGGTAPQRTDRPTLGLSPEREAAALS